jgi:AmmeMemoRadiSam system protein B
MSDISPVRPSPIAGAWYSADPRKLALQVDRFLDAAELPVLDGEVVGVVAPHAGHRYSGRTAGYAFAAVRGASPDLVAVLSPMHAPYAANLLTTAHHAYSTPLGEIPVDRQAVAELDGLLHENNLELAPIAYDKEHALEIELPFLQRALQGSFHLLPVMVRSQSALVARRLGQALAQVLASRRALLVASTDLSHFYTQSTALELDREMLRRIGEDHPDALFEAERSGKGYACGLGAVAAVLWAARALGANMVNVVHHSTSADETGDASSVVGYGAAVVLKKE